MRPPTSLTAPLLHEHEDYEWRRWFSAHGVEAPERLPGPRLWHAHLTLDAARRGQGIVLTNRFLLADDLARGDLVRLPVVPEASDLSFGAYVLRVRRIAPAARASPSSGGGWNARPLRMSPAPSRAEW